VPAGVRVAGRPAPDLTIRLVDQAARRYELALGLLEVRGAWPVSIELVLEGEPQPRRIVELRSERRASSSAPSLTGW